MTFISSSGLPVVVGITGASGAILAKTTIDLLLKKGHSVIATASSAARMVWREEMDESFGVAIERWKDDGDFSYQAVGDLSAQISSGTFSTAGMAIVPCSMASVAAIAHGLADNLIRRAADVSLKERRPLVLVIRETPLNSIHLRNMASLAEMGATILPPVPAFYLGHKTIEDIADFASHRTMIALGLDDRLPIHMNYTGDQ
ncbi:MAG: UbiX family flavin prenyltransferase [SAR202 cluster bacterium]|jgi:4-hydroxy-3-polyprenylbenzoate decarboxylase|nr:UbiX family flavin prenyltransferase [SAR202 cluster bacterium]